MKWITCCKGRKASCPQIALEGNTVHIKDDFGAQITLNRDNPLLVEGQKGTLGGQDVTIYGKGPVPVRMTLEQFYVLLETLDSLENPE